MPKLQTVIRVIQHEEEVNLLLLATALTLLSPERLLVPSERFDFSSLDDESSVTFFRCVDRWIVIKNHTLIISHDIRFRKDHIVELSSFLLPPVVITPNRLRATVVDALCIFLRRLAYPNRLSDCMQFFGRPPCEVSRIASFVLDCIYDTFHHIIDTFDHERLTAEVLERYAMAVSEKGGMLNDTWGFLDGTVRPIARPSRHQRHVYNGHKRVHALKYQGLMAPDGLFTHAAGPWVGRRHDSRMLSESELYQQLAIYSRGRDGRPMRIYGDPAYPISTFILSPFKGK